MSEPTTSDTISHPPVLAEAVESPYLERFAADLPEDAKLYVEAFRVLRQTRLPRGMPSAQHGPRSMTRGAESIDRRRMLWLDRGPGNWTKRIDRALSRFREAARRCNGPLLGREDVSAGKGHVNEDLTRFAWLAQLAEISAKRMTDRKQFEWAWRMLFDLLTACVALRRGAPADQAMLLARVEMRLLRTARRWADRKRNSGDLIDQAREQLQSLYDQQRGQEDQQQLAFLQEQASESAELQATSQRLLTDRRATVTYLLASTFRQQQGFYPAELATIGQALETELPDDPFASEEAPLLWRISDGEKLVGWGVDSPGRKLRTRSGQPLLYSVAADGVDTDGKIAWNGVPATSGNWYFPLPAPKSRRRWFQFDLRSFLVVFTIAALAMAYFSSPAARQKRAIRNIERIGGVLEYDTQTTGTVQTSLIDWFGSDRFGRVTSVDLSDANLTPGTIASLSDFPYLVSLDVSSTNFDDDGLAELSNMQDLESFRAAHTKIEGPGLVHLTNLPKLNYIDLDRSQLSDEGLKHLGQLKRLEHLDMRGTTITDAGLLAMPALPRLTHLYLLDSEITDDGLAWIAKCPRLEHIDLDGSKIKGEGLVHLAGLEVLDSLDIRNTQLEADSLKHLPALKSLSSLMVGNTEVSSESLPHLVRQKELVSFDANGTQIGNSNLKELTKLPKLRSIDLDETNVSQFSAWWLRQSREYEEFTWSPKAGPETSDDPFGTSGVVPTLGGSLLNFIWPFRPSTQPDYWEFDEKMVQPIPQSLDLVDPF